jgi:hypothetical protein
MDLKVTEWEGADWIHLDQDMDKWRALVNTTLNRVPQNGRNLTSWASISFFSEALLHGVNEWVSELVSNERENKNQATYGKVV